MFNHQNDKECFRQFVAGFVEIWVEQLSLNFDAAQLWNEIKNDSGPHLKRLPDELLPAIGKFLIIAKDSYQNDASLDDAELAETTLLLKCLTVVCRHFENIQTVANYQYISCAVAISMNIIVMVRLNRTDLYNSLICLVVYFAFHYEYILQLFKDKRKPTSSEIEYIKAFSQLIEAIYDPYLTWRNFLRSQFADYRRILISIVQLHVELVPFIYGKYMCIQFPEKNECLMHATYSELNKMIKI